MPMYKRRRTPATNRICLLRLAISSASRSADGLAPLLRNALSEWLPTCHASGGEFSSATGGTAAQLLANRLAQCRHAIDFADPNSRRLSACALEPPWSCGDIDRLTVSGRELRKALLMRQLRTSKEANQAESVQQISIPRP